MVHFSCLSESRIKAKIPTPKDPGTTLPSESFEYFSWFGSMIATMLTAEVCLPYPDLTFLTWMSK